MDNRRLQQGIAEITEQAYARRHGINADQQRQLWHVRPRIIVMTIICVVVGSLILYWFVSSILENHRNAREQNSNGSKSSRRWYLDRLSGNVMPLEYTLKILPVLEEGNFTAIGDVQIQFYPKAATKQIRLHAHGLQIKEVTLQEFHAANTSKMITKYVLTGKDFIDIFLMQLLNSGQNYVLRIKYAFKLNEEPLGFFRSKYVNVETNQTRWIAVSNFSPDYAHSAFPCFDEPWIKSPFRISIGRRSEMRSHSNSMRKVTKEIPNMPGYVWDHYEKTLPLPTYVVAFMVTDFVSYDIHVSDRPFHTVFARKAVVKDTEYIGYLVPKLLRSVQNLTGIYYEFDKLDVIVVPRLAYSAMENWGLITFCEDSAVIKNNMQTVDYKKVFASVAAHEVAHQWFGNLVTPKWWSDVWLKEGFSSFFGNLALSIVEPSWTLEDMFAVEFRDMFEMSGAENVHPLHIDLNTLKRLDDIFDETPYVKGNCVVYMMFHFLGRATFLSSIRRYIQTYYYRSADQENIWSAFQAEIDAGKSLPPELTMKDIMRSWTNQAGLPMLQVKRNRETGDVLLMQHRFYNRGLNSTSTELWHIPLTWTTESDRQFNDTSPKAWMTEKYININDSALHEAILNNKWILFNINQTGLYRVHYDMESWKLLIKSYKTLPCIAKVQLLDDAFAISKAGLLDYSVPWNILQNLDTESEELLWSTAISALSSIEHRLWNSDAFKFLLCKLTNRVYTLEAASLLYSDPERWTLFKVKLLKWVCTMGHRTCLTAARNLAEKILRNNSFDTVPEEYRRWLYCTYVKVVTEEQWLTLLERYKDPVARDKDNLAYALGCHSNATLLRRYLTLMFSANETEEKYVHLSLMSTINNPHGFTIGMEFFSRHWQKISKPGEELSTYQHRNLSLTGILPAFSIYMDREENVEWLRGLKRVNEDYDTIIDEVINRVEINVAWNKKHKTETLEILEDIIEKQKESCDCGRSTSTGMH